MWFHCPGLIPGWETKIPQSPGMASGGGGWGGGGGMCFCLDILFDEYFLQMINSIQYFFIIKH